MRARLKFLPILLLPALLAGCSTITNLTPSKQPRNASGLYPIEAAWESREQALHPESLSATLLVGLESFPMEPVPMVRNRWEALVPVPASQNTLHYQFKFDYDYSSFGQPKRNSLLSREFKLEIVDR